MRNEIVKNVGGRDSRIYTLMRDGGWYTLSELNRKVKFSTASISAGLRSFRRKEMGGSRVLKRTRSNREYEYKLIPTAKLRKRLSL